MSETKVSPAWASIAVGDLLRGLCQDATVRASTKLASYVSVPEPGNNPSVIALLSKNAVRLPIGIVFATGDLPEAGSTVRIGAGSIATQAGTWRPIRWWDPRPHVATGALSGSGPDLLGVLEDEPASSFGLPLSDALAIAGSIAARDPRPALASIGLGPGLTPAGDDVVAGALAVLSLCHCLDDQLRRILVCCAFTRTTALSAALLAAAGMGQLIPQAAGVLRVLAAGGPQDRLRSAAGELFAVGATSGHDLCAGMAGALISSANAWRSSPIRELTAITRRP